MRFALVCVCLLALCSALGAAPPSSTDSAATPQGRYDLSVARTTSAAAFDIEEFDGSWISAPGVVTGNVLVNGGFEDGFEGWGTAQSGAGNWFIQSGSGSPYNGFSVSPPFEGARAAMTDQTNPGTNVLFQEFTVPSTGAMLSCALFWLNQGIDGFTGSSPQALNHESGIVQHFRVDIMSVNSGAFATGSAVLQNLLFSNATTPDTSGGYIVFEWDLSQFASEAVRLRFGEVDNQGFLNFGVDDCRVVANDDGGDDGDLVITDAVQIVPREVAPLNPVVDNLDGEPTVFWEQALPGTNRRDGNIIICLQFIDAQGNQETPPLLASVSGGLNGQPTGTVAPDGTAITFWSLQPGTTVRTLEGQIIAQGSAGSSVLGRRFTPQGEPIEEGEIVVTTGSAGESARPKSATDKNGNTFVTWQDDDGVKGRILDSSGNFSTGAFPVAANAQALSPVVATSASGAAVVAWRQTSGFPTGINVQRFQDGIPVGGVIRAVTVVNAKAPAIAMDDDGGFVVAWDQAANGRDVFVRRYTAEGSPVGPAFRAHAQTTGDQERPSIDVNAAGDLAVVWEERGGLARSLAGTAGGTSILGRTFNGFDEATTEEVVVAETENGEQPVAPDVTIGDDDDVTVVFQREDGAGESAGIFRREILPPSQPEACVENATTICLNGGRFRVTADWRTATDSGQGMAERLTDDTAYFWFFSQENVELVVKALDGCGVNNRYWNFAAALTDVEVDIRVDDTATGQSVAYFNPAGPFAPILDTDAFATCPDSAVTGPPEDLRAIEADALAEMQSLLARADDPAIVGSQVPGATCVPTATRLCLRGGRFAVEASFRAFDGSGGQAEQIGITSDTGYFWFFDPANVEIVVKVLDGCGLTNAFWVFAGGLTNVEVDLSVTDTVRNQTVTYRNPLGADFRQIRDTSSMTTCP